MSKSLKNFVTTRDALNRHTARQLRLVFLLHSWKDGLDYSENTMEAAVQYEKMLQEFFLNVKDLVRNGPSPQVAFEFFTKGGALEVQLNQNFRDSQDKVHAALCDNIDTRTALDAMRDLVTTSNIYLRSSRQQGDEPDRQLLVNIAMYLTDMFRIFGAIEGAQLGFPASSGSTSANLEDIVMPYLQGWAKFREEVRQRARGIQDTPLLQLCDQIRDDVLPELGVRLEDRENQPTALKLVPREELLKEKAAKKAVEEAKRLEKERKKAELAAQQAAKEAQRRIPPWEMFKSMLPFISISC